MENNLIWSKLIGHGGAGFRADYWKSNERKYCDFCKCWIADNKPSIQFHENGKRHKANVAKRITDISKRSAKDEKAKAKFDQEFRKMEDAAMKAYMKDCSQYGDMSAQNAAAAPSNSGNGDDDDDSNYGFQSVTEDGEKVVYTPKVDPLLKDLPEDAHEDDNYLMRRKQAELRGKTSGIGGLSSHTATVVNQPPENSLWCEAKADEGHTYYWNVKTNESVWEAPKEGFMTIAEYNKIQAKAVRQQEEQLKIESKHLIDNADEIVAKYRRENFRKYRVNETAKNTPQNPDEPNEADNYQRDPDVLATEAQPYGQWQTVVNVEEKLPDLQLPKLPDYYYSPQMPVVCVPAVAQPPPVKEFKERVITKLEPDLTATAPPVFKKRKIGEGSRKHGRQRLDDD